MLSHSSVAVQTLVITLIQESPVVVSSNDNVTSVQLSEYVGSAAGATSSVHM